MFSLRTSAARGERVERQQDGGGSTGIVRSSETSTSRAVKIDVWSDIACPFCYMAKRNLEVAIAESGDRVSVEYHSYELSPEAPEGFTGSHAHSIAAKLGVTVAEAQEMESQLTEKGKAHQLDLNYHLLQPANTLKAHQVLHLAKARGKQLELKERLMQAYFTDGRNIGKDDELADIAAEVGLDREEVVRALDNGEYLADVQADIDRARGLGIRGVPFFVLDQRYGIAGAQSAATFLTAIMHAQSEIGNGRGDRPPSPVK